MSKHTSKYIKILAAILILLITFVALYLILRPTRLNQPESIVYDKQGARFLISNTGNGKIISLNEKGKYKVFLSKGLDKPRGLTIISGKLYVTDNKVVRVIDLKTAMILQSINVPDSKMLNDIESDHLGYLYVTDTKADRLFIINPATKMVESKTDKLLKAPNGIIYDYPRRQMLIVCYQEQSKKFSANPILSLDIQSKELSVFMPKQPNVHKELDGIAIDNLGRIYYSSWMDQTIYMIPQEQNRIQTWQSGITSPADIYYHQPTNELLVPVFEKNKILRYKLD